MTIDALKQDRLVDSVIVLMSHSNKGKCLPLKFTCISFAVFEVFFGCLYLADYGSTDHGLADHVICKVNSILNTRERD